MLRSNYKCFVPSAHRSRCLGVVIYGILLQSMHKRCYNAGILELMWWAIGENMKILNKLSAIVLVFALSIAAAAVLQPKATAHETGKPHEEQIAQAQTNNQPTPAGVVYSYISQPGDSYTLMARKAVQTYGLKNKVNLSQAKILFAETNLTLKAGSPSLAVGQKVNISENDVKEWADKATKLTAAQEAAWNAYNVGVNFNTNAVGQASR